MIYEKEFQKKPFNWFTSKALATFENDGHPKKRANAYARENPEKVGFIIFGTEKGTIPRARGGGKFYRIANGKSESTSAYAMFLELEYGQDWF